MLREKFEAVRIVEILRSGISSRYLANIFLYGREALLEAIQQDLEAVAEGALRTLILRGDYGEGKTHFLNAIFNLAQERNFAVSSVVLSKDTPFNRLDLVYPKLIAETYLPDTVEPGLEALLRDIPPNSDMALELMEFVRQELHPKIACVLENYWQTPDSYHRYLLYNDLAGEWMPLKILRSLNQINFNKNVKLPKFIARQGVWDYLRFWAYLIRARGYKGWVILFDEFELVGALGVGGRGEAYCNLAHFIFPREGMAPESTFVVFSIASSFWTIHLLSERKPDLEKIPAWFISRGERQKAELAKRAMNALLQRSVTLSPLTAEKVQQLLSAIKDMHAYAYEWNPFIDMYEIAEKVKHDRLRTKIRYAIEYLDLKYLYQREPQVVARAPEEATLEELQEGIAEEND